MKTSNTELRDKLDVIFQNVEDTGYEKETDLPLYLEWLEALLVQSQTNLLDRVEKQLGLDVESFGAIPAERVKSVLNQLRREVGSEEG